MERQLTPVEFEGKDKHTKHPGPPAEVRYLDPKDIPKKNLTAGGMTGCVGKHPKLSSVLQVRMCKLD